MTCQEAQQVILGWEDPDAEMQANPVVAAHIATCPDCQKLIRQMKSLEAAARNLPLPEGYARVPENFLRRVAQEAAAPRRKGCFGLIARRAIAAVLIVAVGIMAIMLLMFNNTPARADVVLGQLVQWNLEIVAQKDTSARASIYQSKAADMQAQAHRLTADDRALADELVDTAHWLTTESDPQAEGQAFIKIAGQLKSRAAAATDPTASAHLNQVYLQIVHDGIEKRINPASLPPAQQQQWQNIQHDLPAAPQNPTPMTPTQPGAAFPRALPQNFAPATGTVFYAGHLPRFPQLNNPSQPVVIPAPPSIARSWSSSSNFEPHTGGDTYVSSGSGGSHAGDNSTSSSNSHSNATSGTVAHRDADSSNSVSAKCDPPPPSMNDDASPTKRTASRSPFSDSTGIPSKLAAGANILSNGDLAIPGLPEYKNGDPAGGDYGKSSISRPSYKKNPDDEDALTPAITPPSSDQAATDTTALCPQPPEKSDDSSDDSLWQKPDDAGSDKSWDKPDDSADNSDLTSTMNPDDDSMTMHRGLFAMDSQFSSGAALLPSTESAPEPATAALLIVGGMLLARRRRPLR